jgi:hypothetical protein
MHSQDVIQAQTRSRGLDSFDSNRNVIAIHLLGDT